MTNINTDRNDRKTEYAKQKSKYVQERKASDPEYRERMKAYNTNYVRESRAKKIAKAQADKTCVECGNGPIDTSGPVRCSECRSKINRKNRELRAERRANRQCTYCGVELAPDSRHATCQRHVQVYQKQIQRKKDNNLCYDCGRVHHTGKTKCNECRKRANELTRQQYYQDLADGLCGYCRKPMPEDATHKICQECRDREKEKRHSYKHRGLCMKCQGEREQPKRSHCNACLTLIKENTKKVSNRKTARGQCALCSISLHDAPFRYTKNPICIPCHEQLTQKVKDLREKREQEGLCIRCGELNTEPRRKHCPECLGKISVQSKIYNDKNRETNRQLSHERNKARREAGLCQVCAKPNPEMKYKLCPTCRDKGNKWFKTYNEQIYANSKEARAERHKNGLCVRCKNPNPALEKQHCPDCLTKLAAQARVNYARNREAKKREETAVGEK